MAEEVFEDVNPNGNIKAVVESDSMVSYLYLFGAEECDFEMRVVWIRNHTEAPEGLDGDRMKQGLPPRNPRAHCRNNQAAPHFQSERLRVVWLPEGNGAALYEDDSLLAIIPPWSGQDDFYGFARDAVGQGPFAWEITPGNELPRRFEEAESYWRLWDNEQLWARAQESFLSCYESQFGTHDRYFAIDGGDWPPKALVQFDREDRTILVTLGVSLRPQPVVEMVTENARDFRRFEIGAVVPAGWTPDQVARMGAHLSGQASYPWAQYSWLGVGHTVMCNEWANSDFAFAALVDEHPAVVGLDLPDQIGDPVNLLWLIPLTEAERDRAVDVGTKEAVSALPTSRWLEA